MTKMLSENDHDLINGYGSTPRLNPLPRCPGHPELICCKPALAQFAHDVGRAAPASVPVNRYILVLSSASAPIGNAELNMSIQNPSPSPSQLDYAKLIWTPLGLVETIARLLLA